ncbi:MAG: hypothetical protein AABX52_04165 [Nanoarchaeota archaeon]|mgnify:CR=1 FL=1
MDYATLQKVIKSVKDIAATSASQIMLPKQAIPISQDHFSGLIPSLCHHVTVFVDAGQATIFSSPQLHVEFIRIYASEYHDLKREKCHLQECFLIIQTVVLEDEIFYKIHSIPDIFSFPLFSVNEPTLAAKGRSVDIHVIANACRGLCEYYMIIDLLSKLPSDSMIVRDGDLDVQYQAQEHIMAQMCQIAKHNNIVLAGVSKTSALLTNTGGSAIAALYDLAPVGLWSYQDPKAKTCFAKFHARSSYIFRVDVIGQDKEAVLKTLAAYSTDLVFLGYPYGLLEADARARVDKEEQVYLQNLFYSSDLGDEIRRLEHASNAHSVLDSMRYS